VGKKFSSAMSRNKNWREAVSETAAHVKRELGGASCDLLVVFVSESYSDFDPSAFLAMLRNFIPSGTIIGCNSSGVICDSKEVEMEPALSVLAMHLEGVNIFPFQLSEMDVAGAKTSAELINTLDIYPPDKPRFLAFADPMSFDAVKFLSLMNEGYKGLPIVGGLASGAVMGAANWLCLNGAVHREGLVGVALTGDIEFDIVVSQGCRPVGKPYVITKAEGNVLLELAGKPALEVVRELIEGLGPKDRKLAEFSLSVGLVMNEQQSSFKRGDFLIRNLVGFDPDANSLMIGSLLKVGQTLQFQVRDAETSAEDFDHFLEGMNPSTSSPRGALLVSCCGRGRNFYGKPDHDAKAIQNFRGPLPTAGFFANGEIGPVGLKNFIHGYTSSLVILR
jgi:small ligand-binding sensory domain FIST